jgi:hypothetical protein
VSKSKKENKTKKKLEQRMEIGDDISKSTGLSDLGEL